jgi:Phosphodiester glycosidase
MKILRFEDWSINENRNMKLNELEDYIKSYNSQISPAVSTKVKSYKNVQYIPNDMLKPKPSIVKDSGGDLIEIIDPLAIKVDFDSNFRKMTINEWIDRGNKNFINLTFFEPNGKPTANFFSNSINHGAKLDTLGKRWPMMVIKPELKIIDNISENPYPIEAFSGSASLIENGVIIKHTQGNKDAELRPRTGIGITSKNEIIVMVTPSSDLIRFANKLLDAGAYHAINMDGGSSSLFVRNGQVLFSNTSPVSTILTW